MLPVATTVQDSYKVIWGNAEDGALNGGTRLLATVQNASAVEVLTVQISVQSTPGAPFVPSATTVSVPTSSTVSIAITGLSGYAMRLKGIYPPASNGAAVTTAVQVEQ
jgi:hypothetical protein